MIDVHDVAYALVGALGLPTAAQLETTALTSLDDCGSATALADICAGSWSALERPGALATNVRLIERNREVDPSKWRRSRVGDGEIVHTELKYDFIHRVVSAGASLVVGHIDEHNYALRRLCESLEYILMTRVWANCYIASGTGSAFGSHSDNHDAIILQLAGRKRWTVHRREDTATVSGAMSKLSVLMTPGCCLAIPAGTDHEVEAIGEFSMHLTFGFVPVAGLADELAHASVLLGVNAPSPESVDIRDYLAHLPDRRSGSSFPCAVSGSVGPDARIRWASRLPPTITSVGEQILVVTRGRKFRFASRTGPVLRALAEGREFSWGALLERSTLAAEELRAFVKFCVANDIAICQG